MSLSIEIQSPQAQHDSLDLARWARIEGKVVLQGIIRKDGTLGDVHVLQAPDAGLGFEEAAISVLQRMRYSAAPHESRQVDMTFTMVVDFRLR